MEPATKRDLSGVEYSLALWQGDLSSRARSGMQNSVRTSAGGVGLDDIRTRQVRGVDLANHVRASDNKDIAAVLLALEVTVDSQIVVLNTGAIARHKPLHVTSQFEKYWHEVLYKCADAALEILIGKRNGESRFDAC
jgi:hypothetical protein